MKGLRQYGGHRGISVEAEYYETSSDYEELPIFQVVFMDAAYINAQSTHDRRFSQLTEPAVDRELRKALLAFTCTEETIVNTGNWGCGAFNGDLEIKYVIQYLAALRARRNKIVFHTCGEGQGNSKSSVDNIYIYII